MYVDSGHVFDIFNGVTVNEMFCIKCKIQASYKAKEIHNVKVMIDPLWAAVLMLQHCYIFY